LLATDRRPAGRPAGSIGRRFFLSFPGCIASWLDSPDPEPPTRDRLVIRERIESVSSAPRRGGRTDTAHAYIGMDSSVLRSCESALRDGMYCRWPVAVILCRPVPAVGGDDLSTATGHRGPVTLAWPPSAGVSHDNRMGRVYCRCIEGNNIRTTRVATGNTG
jgi:hypothetical protein